MFLGVLKSAIISPHLRELCDRNTRISYLIPHQFPPRFKANEFRQLCSLKNIMRKKIFACKKNQNSQLTINNFPPFRVGEKKIVSVKVALSIGAVVLHKTQCLRFLIRDLHLITTSPHHPASFSTLLQSE